MDWTSIAARVLPTIASSYERCLSFFLLVIFRNGSGPWEGGVICTILEESFLCPWSCLIMPGMQEYVLFVQAETWQDI